jgi:hypothetical protein
MQLVSILPFYLYYCTVNNEWNTTVCMLVSWQVIEREVEAETRVSRLSTAVLVVL